MIHVVLVSAHPTEADARTALSDPANYASGYDRFADSNAPYLGVWRVPEPYGHEVHVFTDTAAEDFAAFGWTRAEAPDCLCPSEIPHPARGMQPGAAARHHDRTGEAS